MFLIIEVVVHYLMKIIIILKSKWKSHAAFDSDFGAVKSVLLTKKVVNSYETFDKMEARAQSKPEICLSGASWAQGWGTDTSDITSHSLASSWECTEIPGPLISDPETVANMLFQLLDVPSFLVLSFWFFFFASHQFYL